MPGLTFSHCSISCLIRFTADSACQVATGVVDPNQAALYDPVEEMSKMEVSFIFSMTYLNRERSGIGGIGGIGRGPLHKERRDWQP